MIIYIICGNSGETNSTDDWIEGDRAYTSKLDALQKVDTLNKENPSSAVTYSIVEMETE